MDKNFFFYEDETPNTEVIKHKIMWFVKQCNVRVKGMMYNNVYDLNTVLHFGLKGIKIKTIRFKEVFFRLPENNQILICCDGAAKGNPGVAGFGFIGRRSNGECVGSMSSGIGVATNYIAEVMALVMAGEWAVKKAFLSVVFSLI